MRFIKHTALARLGLGLLSPVSQAQGQDFEQVEIQSIPVAEDIYMLVGKGGNIGVSAGDDGVFLIDDQFAPLTEKNQAAIAELSDQPIRFLVNTHWHFDHTGEMKPWGMPG
ncbi:beta-lactamase-like protein [Leptolyngbya sp. Heron Island J]|uniref:MBL fold metallo-hydrolase n=1 Tax=Leptolyngbya sp. Heron Island J TaxID=1385935 RepID=UPI0003B9E2FA|nr:MBL fold metallo-hydrolase [Leptolyngbya sp. Heron Island J]ESA33388.1 beta-lactamase-like protein [Leptolyngbya sp. Heron Island J]